MSAKSYCFENPPKNVNIFYASIFEFNTSLTLYLPDPVSCIPLSPVILPNIFLRLRPKAIHKFGWGLYNEVCLEQGPSYLKQNMILPILMSPGKYNLTS